MDIKVSTALWILAGALGPSGAAITLANFDTGSEWFFVGMFAFGAGGVCVNAGLIAHRSRTLDQEYDSGYDAGFRDGRRQARPVVVNLDQGKAKDGGIPQAPFRPLAGVSSPSRRSQTDKD